MSVSSRGRVRLRIGARIGKLALAAAFAGAGLAATATMAAAERYEIYVENTCSDYTDALVVVHYLDANDNWRTTRWHQIGYGARQFMASTNNRIYYVYGTNGRRKWKGSDYYERVSPSRTSLGFTERRIPRDTIGSTVELSCP